MNISDIIREKNATISIEVFPPKQGAPIEPVLEAVDEIAKLRPDFMSVTYGAGGGTSVNTVKIASHIQNDLGVPALAHLTCASSTKDEVKTMLEKIRQARLNNVLALRGDIPKDAQFPLPNGYRYASELVECIRAEGGFTIGAACYPEGHVECEHKEDDIANLKTKVDNGCDFLTTQMFFDNNIFYNFLYRIRERGITAPVVAGIMPVTNGNQIKRITQLSGTYLPTRFKAIVDKFGDKPDAMKQAGIAYATEQIIDLFANGVKSVHIYSMNKPDIAAKIMDNLSCIIK